MMPRYSGVILAVASLVVPCVAQAGTVEFAFEFNASQASASGVLTATSNGDGSFTAIAGNGIYTSSTYTDAAISLFPNPNAPGFSISPLGLFSYDDELIPSGAPGGLLTGGGLLFQLLGGTVELNIFRVSSGYMASKGPSPHEDNTGTFTLTAVPEPGTIWLMGAMLLGVKRVLKLKLV